MLEHLISGHDSPNFANPHIGVWRKEVAGTNFYKNGKVLSLLSKGLYLRLNTSHPKSNHSMPEHMSSGAFPAL